MFRFRLRSSLLELTVSLLAQSQRRYARFVRRSHTRARASSIPMRRFAAKLARRQENKLGFIRFKKGLRQDLGTGFLSVRKTRRILRVKGEIPSAFPQILLNLLRI